MLSILGVGTVWLILGFFVEFPTSSSEACVSGVSSSILLLLLGGLFSYFAPHADLLFRLFQSLFI